MHAHKLAGTAACGVAFTVSDICIILMHSVTCHESTDVHDSHVTYTMHDGMNMHAHKLAGTAACGVAFTVSDICIILMHSVTCHETLHNA